jgi:predicted nucleotidyltransferase
VATVNPSGILVKMSMAKCRADVQPLLERVKAHLKQSFGDGIEAVLLYGSYARGSATPDSDIDLLVLTDESLRPSEVRRSLNDVLYDILVEEGELVSVIVIQESFYKTQSSPFLQRVREEAIAV